MHKPGPGFESNSSFVVFVTVAFLSLTMASCAGSKPKPTDDNPVPTDSSFIILNATFLGNNSRNGYGSDAPDRLDIFWKYNLGKGKTWINKDSATIWAGAGWTGQPLMVQEYDKRYLIQGAYDYHLRKFDAATGEVLWQYKFNDVIKGTGTIWRNSKDTVSKTRTVILQGSRSGTHDRKKAAWSYRGISYATGEELWRLNVTPTASYSRDVDASCVIINDTAYIGLENGLFTVFSPDPAKAVFKDSFWSPLIYSQDTMYVKSDSRMHGGNLVAESSPILLGNRLYIASGAGHIYGYNLAKKTFDWEFFTGSDMDGTPAVTPDGCLLVSVEKQYIKGKGGILKLDPRKAPADAVVWYFPTGDKKFGSWSGGVIGSVTTNEPSRKKGERQLAAFSAIDGNLYVVEHNTLSGKPAMLFDAHTFAPTPKEVFRYPIGVSISSPVIVGNRLIAAGYTGVHIFEFDKDLNFKLIAFHPGPYESTPFVYDKKIYLASRDGHLYCFGHDPAKEGTSAIAAVPPRSKDKDKKEEDKKPEKKVAKAKTSTPKKKDTVAVTPKKPAKTVAPKTATTPKAKAEKPKDPPIKRATDAKTPTAKPKPEVKKPDPPK